VEKKNALRKKRGNGVFGGVGARNGTFWGKKKRKPFLGGRALGLNKHHRQPDLEKNAVRVWGAWEKTKTGGETGLLGRTNETGAEITNDEIRSGPEDGGGRLAHRKGRDESAGPRKMESLRGRPFPDGGKKNRLWGGGG